MLPLFAAASLLLACLGTQNARAEGDAAKGRYNWEYTCQHCHGTPQPYKPSAFSDYDVTANRLALYASDAAAITRSATTGYTVPPGNSNDKVEPGQNTNVAMGTWAGEAWNRLGTGSTPTEYAIDFAAYFATFFKLPDAPTIGTATVANGQASVSFTPPKSDLPITSYTVTSNPGGLVASGKASPIILTGLTSGTSYTFTVTATSNAGTGKPSAASNSVTPVAQQAVAVQSTPAAVAAATPAPVIKPTVVPSAIVATKQPGVSTVAPVTAKPAGATAALPVASVAAPTVTKPTSVPAAVPVTALPVKPAVPVNPAPAPTMAAPAKAAPAQPSVGNVATAAFPAPTNVLAKPGSAEAKVFFTVPQGALELISSYTVVAYSGGKSAGINATGASSPIKVTGLTNGMDYTFYVIANGKSGAKVPSAVSNVVTPLSIFSD